MLLAHGAFKAPRSWSSASSTTSTARATSAGCPAPAPGWRTDDGRGRRSPPRRWPASRCCSASSPRRPTSTVFVDQGTRRARSRSPAIVVGSALTAAYSMRFLAGVDGRLADRRHRPPPAASSTTDRPAVAFVAPAAVLAVVERGPRRAARGCVDGLVGAAADCARPGRRRRPPGRVARLQHRARAVGRRARRRHRAVPSGAVARRRRAGRR